MSASLRLLMVLCACLISIDQALAIKTVLSASVTQPASLISAGYYLNAYPDFESEPEDTFSTFSVERLSLNSHTDTVSTVTLESTSTAPASPIHQGLISQTADFLSTTTSLASSVSTLVASKVLEIFCPHPKINWIIKPSASNLITIEATHSKKYRVELHSIEPEFEAVDTGAQEYFRLKITRVDTKHEEKLYYSPHDTLFLSPRADKVMEFVPVMTGKIGKSKGYEDEMTIKVSLPATTAMNLVNFTGDIKLLNLVLNSPGLPSFFKIIGNGNIQFESLRSSASSVSMKTSQKLTGHHSGFAGAVTMTGRKIELHQVFGHKLTARAQTKLFVNLTPIASRFPVDGLPVLDSGQSYWLESALSLKLILPREEWSRVYGRSSANGFKIQGGPFQRLSSHLLPPGSELLKLTPEGSSDGLDTFMTPVQPSQEVSPVLLISPQIELVENL